MNQKSFVDKHDLHDAFLGNLLIRLLDAIEVQGDELYDRAGLSFPPRASSTILLISESDGVTTADIARELHQPHQLATQRVETLIASGLLRRKADPEDARRKKLTLTHKGRREAALLQETLSDAQEMFQDVYDEIGANLAEYAFLAMDALTRSSMCDRIGELKKRRKTKGRRQHA